MTTAPAHAASMASVLALSLALLSVACVPGEGHGLDMSGLITPQQHALVSEHVSEAMAQGAIAMTGGAESPMVAWIVVPTAVVAARFRLHVVFAFASSAVAVASR